MPWSLLGFEVVFGRYRGIVGEIGFDGHWKSPQKFHVVIEVKTTEAYAIKTATLVGYVDELISNQQIPSWDSALGLYVFGRSDREVRQLENAIVAERRTDRLRVISVESMLSLAEMMNKYGISHEDILAILRPSGPMIDSIVDLMARLVAQRKPDTPPKPPEPDEVPIEEPDRTAYWMTPVKSDARARAEALIQRLVGQEGIYAFGERTPGRRHIKPGDWICFYAARTGIVAHAKVRTQPKKTLHPKVRDPEKYSWVVQLESVQLYLDRPVKLDASIRSQLDAFQGRDPNSIGWGWFVQATRKLTRHDFGLLTRREHTS